MIWKKEFETIKFHVEQSVVEIFSLLEKTNDYIPFLSFGDYVESFEGTNSNPYTLDNRMDGFKDDAWLKTLVTFLNSSYSFNNENTSDSKISIFFETMMYLHIWESRPYLRYLKRAANLIENNEYLWKLKISDKKKSIFLENQVIPIFEKKSLKITDIIKKGYSKQIRDAIAHNEYWHNWSNPEIIFENYKLNPKRLKKLHYNEWTEKFCYTFLLAYYLRYYFEMKKEELNDEKCRDGFIVSLMNKKGEKVNGKVFYDKERNAFTGKITQ